MTNAKPFTQFIKDKIHSLLFIAVSVIILCGSIIFMFAARTFLGSMGVFILSCMLWSFCVETLDDFLSEKSNYGR